MTVFYFGASLLAFLALGTPIAYALIISGIVLMWQIGLFDGQIIAQNMLNAANSFPMLAIPLFILAGEAMNAGGLSKRIIHLAQTLVGHRKGGLGYVVIFAGVLLSSLSGSALADAASLSALLLPMMINSGYNKPTSGGLIASASIIGPIIPPSIGFIVFGVSTNLSISKLFLAGIVPGILIAISLCIAWNIIARNNDLEVQEPASWAERGKALIDSFWALMLPIIILVGLRFGIMTPTEAAAVAAVYSIIISCLVYRELSLPQLSDIAFSAAKTSAGVMFLVAAAAIPAWMISIADIPGQIISLIEPVMDHPKLLVAAVIIVILVIGTAMDLTPTILLLGPILVPIVTHAGVDPIYFGVIFMITGAIGLITPPVGTVLNVVCAVGKLEFGALARGVMPFLIAELIVLALMVIIPEIVLIPAAWFSGS
ncbi:TRAP-type C4-dicarboxylate transport system, large permease component [Halomonas citrativorans]|uniref:TRAP transporter large permease protein n=2 Tax=Halomonas citrativorans TaxID=2742612 RepID=A0A1R4I3P1_9GAMM|nr:TRAP-type C4-dicarboxylate transport system, large permease component [Halomonas citrativorans]